MYVYFVFRNSQGRYILTYIVKYLVDICQYIIVADRNKSLNKTDGAINQDQLKLFYICIMCVKDFKFLKMIHLTGHVIIFGLCVSMHIELLHSCQTLICIYHGYIWRCLRAFACVCVFAHPTQERPLVGAVVWGECEEFIYLLIVALR